jgi:hypothetical protein
LGEQVGGADRPTLRQERQDSDIDGFAGAPGGEGNDAATVGRARLTEQRDAGVPGERPVRVEHAG